MASVSQVERALKHFMQERANILEEMTGVVVEAHREVPLELVSRFEAVVLEDSSTVALPNELVTCWQGCGGAPGEGHAAVKSFQRGTTGCWQLHADPCSSQNQVLDQRGQAAAVGSSPATAGGTDQRTLGASRR